LQGLQAKARAAVPVSTPGNSGQKATQEATQASIDEAPVNQGQTVAEVFDKEELEEAAREARRNRKESFDLIPGIKSQAAEILAGELAGFNSRVWANVVGHIYWKTGRETGDGDLDFEKLTGFLGRALVEHETPTEDNFRGIEDPAGYVRRVLNRYLEDKKCPALPE
jgi:hypothetical protein